MNIWLIVVGDELLTGHVQDANTHFIAGRVALHGHRLRRVCIVGDQPEQIAGELRRALGDGADLVIVCGGLGPTHDDRTMDGVAVALERPLEPCGPLAARIEEAVRRIGDAGLANAFGVEGLRKMARAPRGARALECSFGAVPAVALEHQGSHVVVLPGPPRELQTVFLEAVEPQFLDGTEVAIHREEIVHEFPESVLATTMTELQARFPTTSIGSYPQSDHVIVRIAGPPAECGLVADELRAYLEEFAHSDEGLRMLAFLGRRKG